MIPRGKDTYTDTVSSFTVQYGKQAPKKESVPTATAVFARLKNVEIKNENMIALNPNEKKQMKTTVLSLYLKRLCIVHKVITPADIANCKRHQIKPNQNHWIPPQRAKRELLKKKKSLQRIQITSLDEKIRTLFRMVSSSIHENRLSC